MSGDEMVLQIEGNVRPNLLHYQYLIVASYEAKPYMQFPFSFPFFNNLGFFKVVWDTNI